MGLCLTPLLEYAGGQACQDDFSQVQLNYKAAPTADTCVALFLSRSPRSYCLCLRATPRSILQLGVLVQS